MVIMVVMVTMTTIITISVPLGSVWQRCQ